VESQFWLSPTRRFDLRLRLRQRSDGSNLNSVTPKLAEFDLSKVNPENLLITGKNNLWRRRRFCIEGSKITFVTANVLETAVNLLIF